MESQNEMTIWTTEPIDRAFTHSGGAEVKGDLGGREPPGFLGNLWESYPL